MAERKKPVTEPVLDSSSVADKSSVQMKMTTPQFNNVVRFLKRSALDRTLQFKNHAKLTLERLGASTKGVKPVSGMPEGSDQTDGQSLIQWMDRLKPENKQAVTQLKKLYVTASGR